MGQCLSALFALLSSLTDVLSDSKPNELHGQEPVSSGAGIGKPAPAYPHIIQHAYVNRMPDGDTFSCSYRHPDGTTATVRVRVMAIDCPELAQNYGNEAKEMGQTLLLHKTVTLHPIEVDRYGRLVADVITDSGVNYAHYMLQNGAAWHYKQYDSRPELAQLEVDARSQRVGLWSYARPQPPWDYRRRRRNQQNKRRSIGEENA